MDQKTAYLLVNFGGPRSLEEVFPFLKTLLTDQDVIRTPLPSFLHKILFTYVAYKRAKKISPEYALIGGKSPIHADTEALRDFLEESTSRACFTFHRYLPETHLDSLKTLGQSSFEKILVFPLFPQFSYATTGSIARFLKEGLGEKTLNKLHWVSSYATHPRYIEVMQKNIADFLESKKLNKSEVFLFFSAHGVPQPFICMGDRYQKECELSYTKIADAFPETEHLLAYQSKFGKGEWIKPYTIDKCETASQWNPQKKPVIFIPLTFTSDHIETLSEIEHQYLPVIEKQGIKALRCPALNRRADWIDAIREIVETSELVQTEKLIRPYQPKCCTKRGGCRT